MAGRIVGSDVKTATTTSSRDGTVSGSTILIAPCNANDTETMNIPDSGVLFEDGIHVVLSNIDRVTVFHS